MAILPDFFQLSWPGLAPAIHLLEWMDARVEPAHDDRMC
jgi:hypothetical protein